MNLIPEFEARARSKLPKNVYDYIAGGAGDESGLQRNSDFFKNITFINKILQSANQVDTSVKIFGQNWAHPIAIAPTAYQSMVHPRGECEMAEGAKLAGATFILSSLATKSSKEIAEASPKTRKWFQLYMCKDSGITRNVVAGAEESGFEAVVMTVDFPVAGVRYRDKNNQFVVPPEFPLANYLGRSNQAISLSEFTDQQLKRDLNWKDVEWLRKQTTLPILLKGVLNPQDASECEKSGVDGIVVSNHGGRQIDSLAPPAKMLPRIRESVTKNYPVLVDGGIRSGSDIVKCLALGANAVLLGRPAVWALASDGKEGIVKLFDCLLHELNVAMAVLGANQISDLDDSFLVVN